jgi:hypothetical protein
VQDALHLGRLRWHVGERAHELLARLREEGIEALLEGDRARRLPLIPVPQTDPEKCPGYTSTSSGSASSFARMLS